MKRQLCPAANQLVVIALLCLVSASGWAQRINAIAFDKLPQDYQLYPRNAQSEAQIPISGRVTEAGWQYVSVQVFRNKQAVGYKRVAISYTGGTGRFTVEPITIKAEKAEYAINLYLGKDNDSVNVVNRTNLVAGDVYVLTGQSNASAFFRETRTNEYCRTFGKTTGTYGVEPYNPADTSWALSNQTLLTQDVGTLGFEFQQLVLEKYGIPTCLINAAFHWSMMVHHATRTADNPADLTNGYGRMLYRLQKGGLDKSVKALIYRQGESEAYGEGVNWGGYFDIFYKNLKTDLPSIRQFYVYQIDIIDPAVEAAPMIRETQRALVDKYPDIQVVPSVGTAGFDGLHYSDEGYIQNAQELTRLIGRDFYNSADTDNINAPNSRRVDFSKGDRSEITVQFNTDQELVWTEQFENLLLKDHFYLDGRSGEVTAGRVLRNRVILTLKGPTTATKLTYLPPKNDPISPGVPYRGPYITNKRGMRALSFFELPIGAPIVIRQLQTPVMTSAVASLNYIRLSWNGIPDATAYQLELKDPKLGTFGSLTQVSAGTLTYLAERLAEQTTYTFRIKALGVDTESDWYQINVTTPASPQMPVLQAAATFANVVSLSWQPVPTALGYVIERRLGAETTFKSLTTVAADKLAYTDNLLSDNNTCMYRIKATGVYGDSPFATASVQTPAFLASPELVVNVLYNNALTVSWKPVPNATTYQVARKVTDGAYQNLGTFGSAATAIKDTNLLIGTTYTYRIKAIGDRTESPFVSVDAATPSLLVTPTIALTVVYNNAIRLGWSAVPDAIRYQVDRKAANQDYQRVGTFEAGAVAFSDTTLQPGTTYTYRLKAFGRFSESPVAVVDGQTPAALASPTMSLSVVYNNSLQVNWTTVPNATAYLVERLDSGQRYREVGTFKANVVAVNDTSLTPGSGYIYRIRALGDRTSSPVVSASAVTPDWLNSPDLLVTPTSFDVMSLSWKAVPNATYYVLKRKAPDADTAETTVRIEAWQSQYRDDKLTPSTLYQYTLTAYGDKTQSKPSLAAGTTLVLLAVNQEPAITMSLWPNPAPAGQVSLRFSGLASGTLQIIDLRGVVQTEQELAQVTQVPLSLTGYPTGVYIVRLRRATDVVTQKLLIN
ncbi:sialate O-acetylesterase [uncultured Fibrella sp.]|uniref:sialate O-acetylesterase n=1 Tax=uncultured Fibrella sp. TaxID=1284596 RepID=UPI0035CBD7E4